MGFKIEPIIDDIKARLARGQKPWPAFLTHFLF
jgi:hypothetical protein